MDVKQDRCTAQSPHSAEFREARAVAFDGIIPFQQGRGHRPRGYDAQPTPEDGAAQLPRPLVRPEKGDQSRSTLVFSQPGQTGAAIGLTRWTNTSKTRPHSRHWYSNNGTHLPPVLMFHPRVLSYHLRRAPTARRLPKGYWQ